ncbi:efflux RND transporter periplasmic adaptor subunit [Leptolyngbya cf. ectocarpi LEGE 11479]|uniref:Efflux RND transporter periplasmic adaptor subunit n=1 Tax=Leptolyngbya cf. ectocarpi LEGE 11479 TaxID=1828722 RepID=A0A928ZV50_LEPEC|nr:efflux RND transporter periplasmic adaptor subunit [Leptolyngbya ectocarpi]MBE9068029.1 efflux RND transporter periplasmic adaptor subunit [Leptolyngbya cf. ectocarpi LEGE 11479]
MTYRDFQHEPPTNPSHQESANGQYVNGASLTNTVPKKSPWSGVRGIGLGLLLGVGVSLIGGRLSRPATDPPTQPTETASATAATSVTVQRIQTATIQQSLKATGTVQAFDLLNISPQVSGLQIREVRVREGDQVTQGQVLAVLDDSVLRTQLAQAQANYAQAEAQVAQERAEQAQAEANAAEAQDNFERYQTLYDQGGISSEELNSRRTQAITARESVGVAQAAVQSAQATVTSREAEIRRLETQLAQTVVRAPANGQIAERPATVGDTSSTGTALFTMVQDGLLELVVDLPQRQLAAVQVSTPVTVTASTNDRIRLSGAVRSIDPLVNQQTRQAEVHVSLSANAELRTGMFLQAEFMTGQRTGMVLAAAAILPQTDNSFKVFILNEAGTADLVPVTVGSRLPATANQPERLEILSGLDQGDQVIVEGASYLQPGDPVSVVTAPFTETSSTPSTEQPSQTKAE